ncbi:LytR/AlgR family response regulator transcription factor [Algoriphagus algorifonticola]|uniref:LytR/AlgR family response regulator transcription factor n=1 Tax=Algoriphagus algorifonticola TaxID=2593007 RepID=UPI0011A03BCC|nr:response regulator [Algoriphagus algorifonticola]
MEKSRVLIVEEELIIAEDLSDILENLGYDVVGTAISAREALQILGTEDVDLALLDIKIKGGKDGIELAEEINENFKIPIVFLTSHADQMTLSRAKKVLPYGYLVKPFAEKDIHTTLEMALANFKAEQKKSSISHQENEFVLKDSLFVRHNGMLVKIQFQDIIYFEADANYTKVFTKDKKFVIRAILKELERKLDTHFFARIHKSFLINLTAIDAIDSTEVHIAGKKIPLSRSQHSWLINQIKTL